MFRQAIAVIGVLSVAINISLAAIEIGAFNTQIYGKSKASKPEIVEMFLEVTIILLYVVIRSRKRSAIATEVQYNELQVVIYIASIRNLYCGL